MNTLRRAADAGLQFVQGMRTDTDLEALRQRPDFQKLLKEMEARAKDR
jgi:hypothetical protein